MFIISLVYTLARSRKLYPKMIGFHYIALVSIFANVLPANGNVWTVDCSTVATQRKDPIVFPHENQAGL